MEQMHLQMSDGATAIVNDLPLKKLRQMGDPSEEQAEQFIVDEFLVEVIDPSGNVIPNNEVGAQRFKKILATYNELGKA